MAALDREIQAAHNQEELLVVHEEKIRRMLPRKYQQGSNPVYLPISPCISLHLPAFLSEGWPLQADYPKGDDYEGYDSIESGTY